MRLVHTRTMGPLFTPMDRIRARSASPLVQLRAIAKSTNSLLKSPLSASVSHEVLSPRQDKRSIDTMDMEKPMSKSTAEDSYNSSRYSIQSRQPGMSKSTGSFGDLVQDSSDRASTEISTGSSSLVRTKTSFSIHFTQLLLNDSRLKSPSNSSLQVQRPGWDIEVTESTEQVSLEDGVLRNSPEHMRFSAIWSHPISRLYFLMYLIWRGQENLFLLRMEILDYRNGFYKLPSQAARISSAKRIRKMFLTQGSPLFVDFPEYLSDPSVHDVLERVAYLIDTADISIFDDLAFVALLSMEHAFSGQFTPSGIETDRPFLSFKQSGFIQIMRNDLHGTKNLTENQYRRAIERVTEMCNLYSMDISKWETILSYLEDITLDSETKIIQKRKQNHLLNSNAMSKSFVNLTDDITSPISPTKISPRNALNWAGVNHTFLPVSGKDNFCEYCFEKPMQKSGVDELYLCETCGIYSHKNCRNQIQLTCIKTATEGEGTTGVEHGSEKIRIVQEKLDALQREVNIELKIQEGLEKITKAKSEGKPSKTKKSQVKDINTQLEKNNSRLEALKHEMQKRNIQLHALQKNQHSEGSESKKKTFNQLKDNTTSSSLTDLPDTGLLRVIVVDPVTKSEFKKAIYIPENQSTVEVIEMILNKANLSGAPNSYQLSYKLPDSNVDSGKLLKDEDRPMQIENIDYAQTWFRLTLRSGQKPATKDDPLLKKQQEILMEIIESDQKYLDDLKLIQNGFMEPMIESGILSSSERQDIFHNLDDIIAIHEKIGYEIAQAPTHQAKLVRLVDCFTEAVKDFDCYQSYCGNQYQQRHTLKHKQETNVTFLRLLQKCESNPKLQKLNLADMLMKPMQKITRYPLLFKRLLPNLVTDSPEFYALSQLLVTLEKSISDVNETVRNMEARFKIKCIDDTMDFGVIAEKFKIATQDRELLQEKSLQYINKAGTPIEVVVFIFTDLIMIARRSKKADGGYTLFKAPIPLERAAFIDKPDTENLKRVFQIVHQQQELHTLQSYSAFDKNAWLQEAESARTKYCATYLDIETMYSRARLGRYKYQTLPQKPVDIETGSIRASSFFFRRKVTVTEDHSSSTEEDSMARKISKRLSSYNAPLSAPLDQPETKITAQELLIAKNRLSHIPSRGNLLVFSTSFRNLSLRTSPESVSPRPPSISPNDLVQAKQHLSPTKQSKPISPLARSALHAEIKRSPRKLEKTGSSSNLIQKIKNTFRRTDSESSIVLDAVQVSDS